MFYVNKFGFQCFYSVNKYDDIQKIIFQLIKLNA